MGAGEEAEVEPMINILEDAIPKVSLGNLGEEDIAPSVEGGIRGEEVPPPHIPSIDSLLRDIYELRYELD